MNRLVRTRMPGGVGAGRENLLATRLARITPKPIYSLHFCVEYAWILIVNNGIRLSLWSLCQNELRMHLIKTV